MRRTDELADRIRPLVALDPRVAEKRMFGGVCFLLDGRIMVAARRNGALLVQAGAERAALAVAETGVAYMQMRGKATPNFIDVDADRLEGDDDLERWIGLAQAYLATLPPK